ncbi:MAG TPA: GNAT family N-acetyltransferase [Candidatus Didemnitutus sp.]|jgi:hypothetical protein
MSPGEIRHDPVARRYELVFATERASLDYELDGTRQTFTHTWVPPALRGQGIAEKLVRAALDDARRDGHKVIPECSYVATFMRRHPEYADLLSMA